MILEAIDDHEIEAHGIQMMNELFDGISLSFSPPLSLSLFNKIFLE